MASAGMFFDELGDWCERSMLKLQKRMHGLRKSLTSKRGLNLPHASAAEISAKSACKVERDAFDELPELGPYTRGPNHPELNVKRANKEAKRANKEAKRAAKRSKRSHVSEGEGTKEMPIEIDDADEAHDEAPALAHHHQQQPMGGADKDDCIVIDEEPLEEKKAEEKDEEEDDNARPSNNQSQPDADVDVNADAHANKSEDMEPDPGTRSEQGTGHMEDPGPSDKVLSDAEEEFEGEEEQEEEGEGDDPWDDQQARVVTKQPLPPEVEKKEWQERDRVIAAQRLEAVRQKAAMRMQSRQLEQLLKYRREEEEKSRQTQEKERMRWIVKNEIHQIFGQVLKMKKLRDLLIGLGVDIVGGDLTKALRQAKIRYHPDKASMRDLKSRIFSEEISKILNSWSL